jgi:hypothetical protein
VEECFGYIPPFIYISFPFIYFPFIYFPFIYFPFIYFPFIYIPFGSSTGHPAYGRVPRAADSTSCFSGERSAPPHPLRSRARSLPESDDSTLTCQSGGRRNFSRRLIPQSPRIAFFYAAIRSAGRAKSSMMRLLKARRS